MFDGLCQGVAINQLTIVQLNEGTLVTVPASLVRRSKNHFHNLPCGASVILGNNGYIWISPLVSDDHTQDGSIRFQTPSNLAASSVETTTKVNNTHTHMCTLIELLLSTASDTPNQRDHCTFEKLHCSSSTSEGYAV